jgi:hypothetical protein
MRLHEGFVDPERNLELIADSDAKKYAVNKSTFDW